MKVTVTEILPKHFLIRQEKGTYFFVPGRDSILISETSLVSLLEFLVKNKYISAETIKKVGEIE